MAEHIGTVYVDVEPDASGFVRRFEAQTGAGMTEAGRKAGQDWQRGFDSAAGGNGRSTSTPTIRPQVDTAAARAQLAALNRELNQIGANGGLSASQRASILAATNSLTDAQKRLRDARAELEAVSQREGHTEEELAAASEVVARAQQKEELAALRLAAAQERAASSTRQLAEVQTAQAAASREANNSAGGLLGTLIALAPAAIPVAGVLTGAFAGLVPTVATVALGIKGISAEMKSGALAGTQYGKDLHVLANEGERLQAIAAGGLLKGIDQGLASSHGLFRVVNSDVQQMSGQLGNIVAGAAPALLHILTDLNPLFVTFGNLLTRGATELEHWATSSDGVSKFVSYVQAELPQVMHLVGDLVVLLGHVVQAAAPFGGVMLSGINLVVEALDAIPVGVLKVLIPLAVEARLAFMAWNIIAPIIRGVGSSFSGLATQVQGFANRNNVAMLEVQAMEARTAAETAAAAKTASLARLQAAQEAVKSADVVTEAMLQEVAAAKLAAGQTIEAARIQALAAEMSARRVVVAGELSAAGWRAALGPIGLLVGALSLVGLAFMGSSSDSQAATQANNNYAESVKKSTDALNQANLAATAKNLSDEGALSALDQLHATNDALSVSYGDLTNAVNGSKQQFNGLVAQLKAVAQENQAYRTNEAGKEIATGYTEQGKAALGLIDKVTSLRSSLSGNIKTQIALNQAQRESVQSARNGSAAAQAMADRLGVTGKAYLAAEQATAKNTSKTRQQTLAFQLENDAASLLNQALQTLRGQNLGVAQAQTALGQSLHTVIDAMRKGKTEIEGNTKEALNNQQAIQGNVSAARALAQAVAQQTGSNDKATASYRASKQALLDELKAHNELTPAVRDYVNRLYDVKGISDYLTSHPTKLDADKRAAEAALATLRSEMAAYASAHPETHIYADTSRAVASVQSLVRNIDGTVAYVQVQTTGAGGPSGGRAYFDNPQHKASGGPVSDGWFTMGEEGGPRGWELGYKRGSQLEIFSNAQARAMTGWDRVPGYADGTNPSYVVEGQKYDKFKQAGKAAEQAFRAQLHLGVTVDHRDLHQLAQSIKGTAADVHNAFGPVLTDLKQLGAGKDLTKALRAQDDALAASVQARDNATKHLQAVQAQDRQLEASIRQAIASSYDVTTAGANANGKVTPGGMLAQEIQAANRDKLFVSDIEKLTGLIPGPYLRQLATKGPDALPEAEALLHLSKRQLVQFRNEQASIAASGRKLASFEGQHFYGSQIDKWTREQHQDARAVMQAFDRLERRLEHAVDAMENRPVEIKVDGKVIARANANGVRKLARRQ